MKIRSGFVSNSSSSSYVLQTIFQKEKPKQDPLDLVQQYIGNNYFFPLYNQYSHISEKEKKEYPLNIDDTAKEIRKALFKAKRYRLNGVEFKRLMLKEYRDLHDHHIMLFNTNSYEEMANMWQKEIDEYEKNEHLCSVEKLQEYVQQYRYLAYLEHLSFQNFCKERKKDLCKKNICR